MPGNNEDLHGNVPESSAVALLLIDVINDMEFDGAEALVEQAVPMAHRLAELKRRAKEAQIPAIYVNDNFGRWQSDFSRVVKHCLKDGVRGEPVGTPPPLADSRNGCDSHSYKWMRLKRGFGFILFSPAKKGK